MKIRVERDTFLDDRCLGVMYAGRLVELGAVQQVIHAAHHPYSRGLMSSIPLTDVTRERLHQIPGSMPRLTAIPHGCAFHPRCEFATDRCAAEVPVLDEVVPFRVEKQVLVHV